MRLLHPALFLLLRLNTRAYFRRFRRSVSTLKGAFAFGFLALSMLWWIPVVVMVDFGSELGKVPAWTWLESQPELARNLPALALLTFCLLTLVTPVRGTGLLFRPSEIDFLFPAPVSRRHLIGHKLFGMLLPLLPTAMLFTLYAIPLGVVSLPTKFIGISLSVVLITLVSISYRMLTHCVVIRMAAPVRALALLILLILLSIAAVNVPAAMIGELHVPSSLITALEWLLLPFIPFARVLSAQSFSFGTLVWAVLAFALDAALFYGIIALDADYREAAIKSARVTQERLGRLRRGGSLFAMWTPQKVKHVLPMLPRLGGSGGLLWRQLVTAQRHLTKFAFGVLLLAALLLVLGHSADGEMVLAALTPFLVMSVFFLPQWIVYDFRSDLQNFYLLKSLPISPLAITMGQLGAPVLIGSLTYIVFLGCVVLLLQEWMLLPIAIVLVPLLVLLLFAVENLVFLYMPAPLVAAGAADFRVFARTYLTTLMKALVLALFVGLAAGLAALAGWVSGSYVLVPALTAFLVLAVEIFCLVWAVSVAFQRLDVDSIPSV